MSSSHPNLGTNASQSVFERSSLKNLSNEELEKLIQQKTQSIEKLQHIPNYPLMPSDSLNRNLTSSASKTNNSNVNHILHKYNLTVDNERKTNDSRPNESNFLSNLDTVPVVSDNTHNNLNFTNSGSLEYKNNVVNQLHKPKTNASDANQDNLLTINITENPYLSNLESSIDRFELNPRQGNHTKDNDSLVYNQDYGQSKENHLSLSAYEHSPNRYSGNANQNKENVIKALSRSQLTPKQSGPPKPLRNDGGSPGIYLLKIFYLIYSYCGSDESITG